MRRLPSGSLNILWMWLAVPIGYRSSCSGSSSLASRCVNTAIRLPLDTASSMSRTELSRATASGMNEFGKQHRVAQRQHRQLAGQPERRRRPDSFGSGRAFELVAFVAHERFL